MATSSPSGNPPPFPPAVPHPVPPPPPSPLQSHEIDLDSLISSLPACKRCRDCRRGCDTLLPKCRQCTKAGVECVFFDHGKKEHLNRSYIAKLVDRVREISATSASSSGNPSPPVSGTAIHAPLVAGATLPPGSAPGSVPAPAPGSAPGSVPVPAPGSASGSAPVSSPGSSRGSASSDPPHFEHNFALAGGSYRYLGAEACLVKSHRPPDSLVRSPAIREDDAYPYNIQDSTPGFFHKFVQTYLNVLQPLYPIVDPSLRFLAPIVPSDLTPIELFSLNMIYSIGSHLRPSVDPTVPYDTSDWIDYHSTQVDKYREFADFFMKRAMVHLDAATAENNIATLRAVLLLAINSLFDPQSGNLGQQVAFAARLALGLEARAEMGEFGPEDKQMIENMHMAIFIIENDVASTLDRPTTFPEPKTEVLFDASKPSQYLCSLFRLQHRYRKGDQTVKNLLPRFDEAANLPPGLRLPLHQTHFLIQPVWMCAWHVLEAVVSVGAMHFFTTPHWVYRSVCVMLQNIPSIWVENLIQLYANALVVLQLSSYKWPSTFLLNNATVDLMRRMKLKFRPGWEGKQIHYDVRI
ncbi:hypothetical protein BU24DRAFT_402882 [Aaosphaeria arxii CBS 175.79]|uniref:Zn(2)-C6 fungal-type domain-containing protein n=1 Tax=Aaosphaeria arxii CBS 175.79 TaxID=1450172 RepID=A0A6A5X6T9_9PLEO|nr:uncharacterized protein BU24DRAFT_402882 [Aaosphaeria arxii CBS 175.79]KAF2008649.1 hypothetical protein BU24DRAFT_402882 [Aaosphaeria arxii CBS 175.79]